MSLGINGSVCTTVCSEIRGSNPLTIGLALISLQLIEAIYRGETAQINSAMRSRVPHKLTATPFRYQTIVQKRAPRIASLVRRCELDAPFSCRWPHAEARRVHQYGVTSMMLGAALRLMKLNYLDGQAVQFRVNATAEELYAQVTSLTLDDMRAFGPAADILAALHVRSHVRMFMN